nr:hypothetical protein [uncultured Pseudomonas sp.]
MTDTTHAVEVLPKRNVFIFPDSVDVDNREAAKLAHMYSMAAASGSFHPLAQTEQWFHKYTEVMNIVGWTPVNYKTEVTTTGGAALEASNLVGKGLRLAASYMSGDAKGAFTKVAKDALEAIASAPDAVEVFKHSGEETDSTALTLSHCEQSPGGEVIMYVVSIQTDGDPVMDHTNALFNWTYHSKVTVTNAAALTFNRRQHLAMRDHVEQEITAASRAALMAMVLKL